MFFPTRHRRNPHIPTGLYVVLFLCHIPSSYYSRSFCCRVDSDPSYPPPLPPKKRQRQFDDICAVKNSMDCLSLRSKSPEDSSSLLSASAGSLDSVLNHSRQETLFHPFFFTFPCHTHISQAHAQTCISKLQF